ncbi:hypothetical protein [Tritonibacter sp. SIMBA_163]|uniref:hypothetical protein n=1 Tax=Tritonibacter sp. SIMBA_163 TaxID=3080868 RepID=UPI003981402A
MDLSAKYTLSYVSQFTEIPAATLQNWLKRNVVVGHRSDAGGGSQGRHRLFSFFSIMQFAITKELLDAGMGSASEAAKHAIEFAHSSEGEGVDGLPERNPSFPFHYSHGDTLFAVGPEDTAVELWTYDGNRDTYGKLRSRVGKGFVVIDASDVFNRVCARMNLHPIEVLDQIYPNCTK